MEKPPGADDCGKDEEPEGLIALEEAALPGAAVLRSLMLCPGFDLRLHPRPV